MMETAASDTTAMVAHAVILSVPMTVRSGSSQIATLTLALLRDATPAVPDPSISWSIWLLRPKGSLAPSSPARV